ncbi:Unknown protein, partial [Striga hermonthica]
APHLLNSRQSLIVIVVVTRAKPSNELFFKIPPTHVLTLVLVQHPLPPYVCFPIKMISSNSNSLIPWHVIDLKELYSSTQPCVQI